MTEVPPTRARSTDSSRRSPVTRRDTSLPRRPLTRSRQRTARQEPAQPRRRDPAPRTRDQRSKPRSLHAKPRTRSTPERAWPRLGQRPRSDPPRRVNHPPRQPAPPPRPRRALRPPNPGRASWLIGPDALNRSRGGAGADGTPRSRTGLHSLPTSIYSSCPTSMARSRRLSIEHVCCSDELSIRHDLTSYGFRE